MPAVASHLVHGMGTALVTPTWPAITMAEAESIVIRLLPLVHLELALSEVDYFHGVLGEPDHAAMVWDTYLIGHAEWFPSPSGRDFITQIRRGAQP
jgi:hypothetical protein